jgi:fluoride exporter
MADMHPELRGSIAVSLGAIAGALSRYHLNGWIVANWGNSFPWGILAINLSGCWLMGLIVGLVETRTNLISPEVYLLLTTGFLGAYTTFSTYGLDTVKLLTERWQWGIAYAVGSAVVGILNVRLGSIMAHWFAP